jgi:predicted flap endonuclease-1-like 5' DNA nuclease
MNPVATILIAVITFLIGALIGWLVEWRMDLAYWHTYFKDESEVEPDRVMIVPPAPPPQLPPVEDSLLVKTLREQLTERERDLDEVRAELAERERGWRERETQLRETTERRTLTTIEQFNANESKWRETAAAREAELSDEVRRLRGQVDDLLTAKTDLDSEWRHELARREQEWQERKDAEVSALNAEVDSLRTQLGDVEARFAYYQATHPDDLAAIDGIGPKIQEDLRRAGINSFAELARRSPEELHVLLNPPNWRKLDYGSWIAEARQRAAMSLH